RGSSGHTPTSCLSIQSTTSRDSTMATDTSHPPAPSQPPSSPPTVLPPAPAPPGHLTRLMRWVFWSVLIGIAIIAAYVGYHWWNYRQAHSITDDAFVEAHIVNVAPEMVSGRIVRFLVDENDRVEQGKVLAVIETVHYKDQVDQAQGKLELAEA